MISDTLQSYVADFNALRAEEKYDHLIDLAKQLPDVPDDVVLRRVPGCMSAVDMGVVVRDGVVYVYGRTSSLLVGGLLFILIDALSGSSVDDVLHCQNDVFAMLGLDETLTPSRSNAAYAMLQFVKVQLQ